MPLDHDRIRTLRLALGLTQAQAGERAGWLLSRQTWSRLERGDVPNPRTDTLQALARVLGVGAGELLK